MGNVVFDHYFDDAMPFSEGLTSVVVDTVTDQKDSKNMTTTIPMIARVDHDTALGKDMIAYDWRGTEEMFNQIKIITDRGNIGISDYIREAIQEKLANQKALKKEK